MASKFQDTTVVEIVPSKTLEQETFEMEELINHSEVEVVESRERGVEQAGVSSPSLAKRSSRSGQEDVDAIIILPDTEGADDDQGMDNETHDASPDTPVHAKTGKF